MTVRTAIFALATAAAVCARAAPAPESPLGFKSFYLGDPLSRFQQDRRYRCERLVFDVVRCAPRRIGAPDDPWTSVAGERVREAYLIFMNGRLVEITTLFVSATYPEVRLDGYELAAGAITRKYRRSPTVDTVRRKTWRFDDGVLELTRALNSRHRAFGLDSLSRQYAVFSVYQSLPPEMLDQLLGQDL